MTDGSPLAALVPKAEVDEYIATFKAAGWYDRDRRIREADAETLEIPIHAHASTVDVPTVPQQNPPWRVRELVDILRDRGWEETDLAAVPASWAVIGEVIVGRFDACPRPPEVGAALLDLHGSAHTVLHRSEIAGAHREPAVRVIAGTGETRTVHVEHGTTYALDLATVMFSPGNKAERVRMGKVVRPGETVLDMFAGIGYFALPMARAGARVTAIERNPAAVAFLVENRDRNDVQERLSVYRGDCATVVPRLVSEGARFDRIVMGHFDADRYLDPAIAALRDDGRLYVHAIGPADDPYSGAEATLAGAGSIVTARRVVKTHGPGTVHVVCEARPSRSD